MKLHELLQAAMTDFEILEKTPGFKIDMWTWMRTDVDDTCYVCLAGAYLHRSLGLDRPPVEQFYTDNDWNSVEGLTTDLPTTMLREAKALDYLRRGWTREAYAVWYEERREDVHNFEVDSYMLYPGKWRSDMLILYRYLREQDI